MSTLVPVRDNPNWQQAVDLGAEYDAKVVAIRADTRLSDLAKAEQIDTAWRAYQADFAKIRDTFYTQISDRLAVLEARVPIGPDIAPGTSQADTVVLQQAFARKYQEALEQPATSDLATMYTTAVRFGDDMTVRAVLTAALDTRDGEIVKLWAGDDPTRQADLDEASALRAVYGGGTESLFAAQAFGPQAERRRPEESWQLDRLRQTDADVRAFQAGTAARESSFHNGTSMRNGSTVWAPGDYERN